jgi:hypothetical protein
MNPVCTQSSAAANPLDHPSQAGHESNTKLNTVIGAFNDAPHQQLTVEPLY